MQKVSLSRSLMVIGGALALCAVGAVRAQADYTVHSGYDLFQTDPSSTIFNGVNFQGVPLGTYNFGGGPVGVGNTDTIIQRTQDAVAAGGSSATINAQIVALQLESVAPVNGHTLFLTLDPTMASTGQTTINFNSNGTGGTFSSFFDVFFDLHTDSLNGTIEQKGDIKLMSDGGMWSRIAPPGAVTINGINNLLDGVDTNQDFWSTTSSIPEPAYLQMGTLLTFGLLGAWRIRRSK